MLLAGQLLARTLWKAGIPWVSGVPGESFLPFLDGLRSESIPFLVTSHESGATFLAAAYARASGTPAVVAVTRGPGAANALIGVHEAEQAEAPIVLIVGQIESRLRGRGAMQEIEFTQLFQPVAKRVFEVTRPDQLSHAVVAALRLSRVGRPGPVVVSVPSDHFYGEVKADDVPLPNHAWEPGVLSEETVRRLVERTDSARAALLLLGADFAGGRHRALVEEAADVLGAGVLGGHAFPDVLPPDAPSWLGCSTIRGSVMTRRILMEADVILSFGQSLGDRVTQGYLPLHADLHVMGPDPSPGWDEYLGAHLYSADPVRALEQMVAAAGSLGERGREGRLRRRRLQREALDRERAGILDRSRTVPTGGVPYSAIVHELDQALPSDAIVVSDAGSFNDWIIRYFPFSGRRRYYGPVSGSMGFAVPSGIGVQLAHRDRKVVMLTGDGGFQMTGMELGTVRRLQLPVTIVVFRNQIHGSIALHQDRRFPDRRFGIELASPSFADLAVSFGGKGYVVNSQEELPDVLGAALASDVFSLVEVACDATYPSPSQFEAAGQEATFP